MSQYGMQMPGGSASRSAAMNIYTGLLFAAVIALIAASAWMYVQGAKIAPDGQPFKMHGDKIQLR